jgi:hypothetical protein
MNYGKTYHYTGAQRRLNARSHPGNHLQTWHCDHWHTSPQRVQRCCASIVTSRIQSEVHSGRNTPKVVIYCHAVQKIQTVHANSTRPARPEATDVRERNANGRKCRPSMLPDTLFCSSRCTHQNQNTFLNPVNCRSQSKPLQLPSAFHLLRIFIQL